MAKIGIIMGSDSDMPVMKDAIEILKSFDIEIDVDIVSAHRTPKKLFEYAKNAPMPRIMPKQQQQVHIITACNLTL